MNKLLGWLLILIPVLVIIGLLVQNNQLWIAFDIYIILVNLIGGVIFLQKNA